MQVCSRCVMDESDPEIFFDGDGVCNHCIEFAPKLDAHRPDPADAERRLQRIADRLKAARKDRPYDSIVGLSGGVDSSYVAYTAHRLGLRPLAVHCDNGWNSTTAVSNIERIVEHCGFDLYTYVIDWDEFRDIQRAFIVAGVIDIEMITDHAILAVVYRMARKHGIKFVLTGTNHVTEHGMPRSWLWNKQDLANIRAIHARHGTVPLKTFPTMSTFEYLSMRYMYGIEHVELLNELNYTKRDAMETMRREFGWQYYGGKHYESVFTKFYQAYILPTKFGADKRRVHHSALIRSGEMTREEALLELSQPPYDVEDLAADKRFVLQKLGFNGAEFDEIMRNPPRAHTEYSSDKWLVDALRAARGLYRGLSGRVSLTRS